MTPAQLEHQPLIYGIGYIMTKYRYDQLAFSSVTANFINTSSPTGSIACSGTIANGSGANFSTTITMPSGVQFSDIFLTNQNTGNKSFLNNNTVSITAIWQYVSTETVQISTNYSGNSVVVEISVSNNTGSTITLTSQTYVVDVFVYNIPF